MAMYFFKKKVSMYCALGVNFRDYLYVPEVSECTGEPQHEREDYTSQGMADIRKRSSTFRNAIVQFFQTRNKSESTH